MSIVKWTKDKIASYFGLGDYKTKFLNNWFENEIMKAGQINMDLDVSLEVIELLHNLLRDRSDLSVLFRHHYNDWKIIISIKLFNDYNLVISLNNNEANKLSF